MSERPKVRVRVLIVGGIVVVAAFVATAIVGRSDAVHRETLVRARVWCEAVEDRDALRYQETFRRGYFRGEFDRAANRSREPTEEAILAQMPKRSTCEIAPPLQAPPGSDDVLIPVDVGGRAYQLRMRREAGFWVVFQVLDR